MALDRILRKIKKGAVGAALALTACASSNYFNPPRPDLGKEIEIKEEWSEENNFKENWNTYIKNINDRCENRDKWSLEKEERLFHPYIDFISEAAGKEFDVNEFYINSDNFFNSIFEDPVMGIFLPRGGVYHEGSVNIKNSDLDLSLIAHEYGHGTDIFLDYADYFFDDWHKTRAEAVAEAFKKYVGINLIKKGNINEGWEFLKHRKGLRKTEDYETIDDFIDYNDEYTNAQVVVGLINHDIKNIGETWYWLATNNDETVYERIKDFSSHPDWRECLKEGLKSRDNEKRMNMILGCMGKYKNGK